MKKSLILLLLLSGGLWAQSEPQIQLEGGNPSIQLDRMDGGASIQLDPDYQAKAPSKKHLKKKKKQAVEIARKKGFRVVDVDFDEGSDEPMIVIDATKNGRHYDLLLAYDDLEVLQIVEDDSD